jgi:hypothetical protein
VLGLTFNVEAGALADGASVLFLPTANIESSPTGSQARYVS